MQLIDNWKQALSMTSVQAGGAIAALGVAEQLMPSLQAVLPPIAYGVLGLTQPLRTIDAGEGYVMGCGLTMQAALVPLKGRWVCDGLIKEPVWLGPGYKRRYTESYTALRKADSFSLGPPG